MQTPSQGPWSITREHERYLIDVRLVIRTGSVLHGRTKNISEGGLGATVAGDMKLGDIVRLEFQLPEHEQTLTFHAEVRYRQGFQFGFKFINPTAEQVQIIKRAIRYMPIDVTRR
jgi:PilZ domain-containing protein